MFFVFFMLLESFLRFICLSFRILHFSDFSQKSRKTSKNPKIFKKSQNISISFNTASIDLITFGTFLSIENNAGWYVYCIICLTKSFARKPGRSPPDARRDVAGKSGCPILDTYFEEKNLLLSHPGIWKKKTFCCRIREFFSQKYQNISILLNTDSIDLIIFGKFLSI